MGNNTSYFHGWYLRIVDFDSPTRKDQSEALQPEPGSTATEYTRVLHHNPTHKNTSDFYPTKDESKTKSTPTLTIIIGSYHKRYPRKLPSKYTSHYVCICFQAKNGLWNSYPFFPDVNLVEIKLYTSNHELTNDMSKAVSQSWNCKGHGYLHIGPEGCAEFDLTDGHCIHVRGIAQKGIPWKINENSVTDSTHTNDSYDFSIYPKIYSKPTKLEPISNKMKKASHLMVKPVVKLKEMHSKNIGSLIDHSVGTHDSPNKNRYSYETEKTVENTKNSDHDFTSFFNDFHSKNPTYLGKQDELKNSQPDKCSYEALKPFLNKLVDSPDGWLGYYFPALLPCRYKINFMRAISKYDVKLFRNNSFTTTIYEGYGLTHSENNWGCKFPTSWIYSQGSTLSSSNSEVRDDTRCCFIEKEYNLGFENGDKDYNNKVSNVLNRPETFLASYTCKPNESKDNLDQLYIDLSQFINTNLPRLKCLEFPRFVLAGAHIEYKIVKPMCWVVAYHSKKINWQFIVTHLDLIEHTQDWLPRNFFLKAKSRTHRTIDITSKKNKESSFCQVLEIEIDTTPDSFKSFYAPSKNGFISPGCIETYTAIARVNAYLENLNKTRKIHLEESIMLSTMFELGGNLQDKKSSSKGITLNTH